MWVSGGGEAKFKFRIFLAKAAQIIKKCFSKVKVWIVFSAPFPIWIPINLALN